MEHTHKYFSINFSHKIHFKPANSMIYSNLSKEKWQILVLYLTSQSENKDIFNFQCHSREKPVWLLLLLRHHNIRRGRRGKISFIVDFAYTLKLKSDSVRDWRWKWSKSGLVKQMALKSWPIFYDILDQHCCEFKI